jgi:cation diffusion facilitator family transporter
MTGTGPASTRAGPVTRALVRRFVEPPGRTLDPAARRAAAGILEGWVSIVLNTVLFAVKLALGLLTASVALVADAAHTLSDSVTSIVVVVGARVARRPPDAEHPFGHGRAEAIAAVAIAVLLAVAGLEFGRTSVERLWHPAPLFIPWWAVGVVAATIVVKEWLSRFAAALARWSGNRAVEADAWHHRSDVFATALVVVAMIGGRYGLDRLDGVMGLGVSLLLAKVSWNIVRGAVDPLLGEPPAPTEVAEIRRQALDVEGVRGVHDIVVHRYGSLRFVSLHVEIPHDLDSLRMHAVAEEVEHRIAPDGHGSIAVHVDPIDTGHPAYDRVRALLARAVADDPDASGFHDMRIVGGADRFAVVVDVTLRPSRPAADLPGRLQRALHAEFPDTRLVVEIDPPYAYSVPPEGGP